MESEYFDVVSVILPTKATNAVRTKGVIKMLPLQNRTRGDVLAA